MNQLISKIQTLHVIVLHMIGDFNISFSNINVKDLCDMFELNHLINPNLGGERGGG